MNLPGIAFSNVSEFFAMGGHALYVWSAWGLTAACLVGLVIATRLSRRALEADIRRRLRRDASRHSSHPALHHASHRSSHQASRHTSRD
ncbi:MAG: heme exporter protein CcmD [Cobetia sp.]|jgi:heme exporter protein D|uniref:heme exporter protein CcmD n=1 Tax=Cobetia sp. TaxID=1873876 RepID=UPI00257C709E|nr:heme exporter protein CcmD [Cobetia sp.]|tara:strand:- start:37227 stop:37493 length:267 start_codon:yes stop_codon:yes gene_type:complete